MATRLPQLKTRKQLLEEARLNKQEKLDKFVEEVRTLRSVDFPLVARRVGLDYFEDIEPEMESPEFRLRVERALKEIKFELVDKALTVGRTGKDKELSPELSYIKQVISYIDSGILFPEKKRDDVDQEAVNERLRRLGLTPQEPARQPDGTDED